MTQFTKPSLDATVDTGVTLAAKFNGAMNALYSNHQGGTAPTTPTEGMTWIDTSGISGTPSLVRIRTFQNGSWFLLGTLNLTDNTYSISGAMPITGGTFTGNIVIPAGTAAAPSLRWVGGSTSGLSMGSGNSMVYSLNGVAHVTFGTQITSAGDLRVTKAEPRLWLNKAASGERACIDGRMSTVLRWSMDLGGNSAETGNNIGSNFNLFRYSDAGNLLGTALTISRASGLATFGGEVAAPAMSITNPTYAGLEIGGGNLAYIDLKAPASNDYNLRLQSGGTGGSIYVANGNLDFVNGGSWAVLTPNHFQVSDRIIATRLQGGPSNAGALNSWNGANVICFRWQDDMLAFRVDEVVDRMIATATNAREFGYAGGTGGPTGISLNGFDNGRVNLFGIYVDAISDARIKKDVAPTTVDALTVLKSVPVRTFQVKADVVNHIAGIGLSPEQRAARPASSDTPVPIGFVAQELMALIPEAVTVRQQGAESPLPQDLHQINQTMLIPYLVRAIQQQQAQIDDLQSRIAALEAP